MFAAGGRVPVPEAPDGHSGLTGGARAAGGAYQQAQAGADGLDGDSGQAVAQGGEVGAQGRAGSGLIRDQARAVGAATAGMGRSPAGAKLIMAAMDDHLAAMQRQLDQTTAENRLLAMRMRQLAAGYRGLGAGGMGGGMPLSGLGGLMSGGGGGGGLSGLSGLGSLPGGWSRLVGSVRGGRGTRSEEAAPRGDVGTALGGLTQDSSPREVAAAIIHEARRRGYSPHQTIAILSTAMQESGLRPRAVSPNGLWRSIFQQDAGYPGRNNPNTAISGFFDRLAHHGGPSSPDIWKSIFWLQQRPGDSSAEAAVAHGRRGYLNEIQSQLPRATALYRSIAGV
ncbi:hypothetical protein Mkiyose1383_52590 [Mycobacterium kiyosense]|nr:hypothetical protein Mkiyose1383_52590 [Mycobacterium kiyosense]